MWVLAVCKLVVGVARPYVHHNPVTVRGSLVVEVEELALLAEPQSPRPFRHLQTPSPLQGMVEGLDSSVGEPF